MAQSMHKPDKHDFNKLHHAEGKRGIQSWFSIPDGLTVGSFPFKGEIVEVLSTDSVNDAFHKIVKKNILSAPVWDEKTKRYLGILDTSSFLAVSYMVSLICSVIPEDGKLVPLSEGEASIQSLLNLPKVGLQPWTPIYEDTPFIEVLALLAETSRRVPVLSRETGRVVKIVSQSAVVTELSRAIHQSEHLPAAFRQSAAETGIGIKPVITLNDDIPVKSAFKQMVENNVSAIGITDEEGKLYSCVSTKDIRLLPRLGEASITGKKLLNSGCREYISMARQSSEKSGKSHATVAVVSEKTPLLTTIGKLAETKMHRIFIVNAKHEAIGVLSVSDVIQMLLDEALFDKAQSSESKK